MNPLAYLCLGLGLLSLLLVVVCYRRIRQGRVMSSVIYGLQGLLVITLLISTLLVNSNLSTYQRLTFEENILELSIKKISTQKFQIQLSYLESAQGPEIGQIYLVAGDEWQIDTRIIKWKSWANLMGMDSFYRLERLSGRYADINQANASAPTAYRLSEPDKGINVWKLKRLLKTRLSFIDAYYGQAVYLPMQDGARFILAMSQSGLLVRPANDIAQEIILEW